MKMKKLDRLIFKTNPKAKLTDYFAVLTKYISSDIATSEQLFLLSQLAKDFPLYPVLFLECYLNDNRIDLLFNIDKSEYYHEKFNFLEKIKHPNIETFYMEYDIEDEVIESGNLKKPSVFFELKKPLKNNSSLQEYLKYFSLFHTMPQSLIEKVEECVKKMPSIGQIECVGYMNRTPPRIRLNIQKLYSIEMATYLMDCGFFPCGTFMELCRTVSYTSIPVLAIDIIDGEISHRLGIECFFHEPKQAFFLIEILLDLGLCPLKKTKALEEWVLKTESCILCCGMYLKLICHKGILEAKAYLAIG
jgi:hypothetical protein